MFVPLIATPSMFYSAQMPPTYHAVAIQQTNVLNNLVTLDVYEVSALWLTTSLSGNFSSSSGYSLSTQQ
jgi:hypothetical protein